MPSLLIYHTSGAEEEREVVGELTMGRQEGNDVVLAEGGVSRRHARFYIDGDELWVEDLGSSNGTFVDGERIDSPVCLSDKAQLYIGDCEMVVRLSRAPERDDNTQPKAVVEQSWDDATVAPQRSSALAKKPAAQARLICVGEPADGQSFELTGTCIVGRVPGAEIHVEDTSISRRHAEVEVRADGSIWLTDLESANGTCVNSEQIQEATRLSDGDVVHFGSVEMRLQIDGAAAARKPPRGGALARRPERRLAASRSRPEEAEAVGGKAPRRKKLLLVVTVLLAAVVLVAVALKLMSPEAPPHRPIPSPLPPSPPGEPEELERALRGCRQHTQVVSCVSPNYRLAAEACRRALDMDPLHAEANSLKKKMDLESECANHFNEGKQAVELEPEKALKAFLSIDAQCIEYQRCAAEPMMDARRKAENQAKKDCQEYTKVKAWRLAYDKCDLYMNLICPQMREEELYPPGGKKLVVSAGPLKRNEWRPENVYYQNFLMARAQIEPLAAAWRCPEGPMPDDLLAGGPANKEEEARKWFAERFKQADFEQAMLAYFTGKTQEALSKLTSVRSDMRKVELHEAANRMQVQIRQVDRFFNDGMALLEKANVTEAAARFQSALDKDRELILGEASTMSELEERAALNSQLRSFFRNNVMVDMPHKCLSIGEDWRKRSNPQQACQIWKVGYHFNKNNTDLLSTLTLHCTSHANELLRKASTCSALREVLEYAVEGDGLRQKVERQQEESGCPR